MGSCLGKCLPTSDYLRNFNLLPRQKSVVDFAQLIEDKPVLELVDDLLYPNSMNYSRLNESQRLPSVGSCTSRDIQLQCLDARALLVRTTTSTPPSSLDLEWEHETLPISLINDPSRSSWSALQEEIVNYPLNTGSRNTTPVGISTESDWSRVSSANSLEWDSVPNTFHGSPPASDIDTDTQLLLSEIERLTNQTLRETEHWTLCKPVSRQQIPEIDIACQILVWQLHCQLPNKIFLFNPI